jgi:hypothetical protein
MKPGYVSHGADPDKTAGYGGLATLARTAHPACAVEVDPRCHFPAGISSILLAASASVT